MKEKKERPESKLRRARELRGWTQKALADNICLPDTRLLRRWESGEVVPSPRYRTRLCEIFEMNAEELGILSETDVPIPETEASPLEEPYISMHTPSTAVTNDLPSYSPANHSLNLRNRLKLLEKVNTFWINEVLEQSLSGNAPLTLELHVLPDAVTSPWDQVIDRPSQRARPLPLGTPIHQIYDSACGELLILGAPGSGKTTLLLELTRTLLQRAFADETYPMPVVFNLSSWSLKCLPLTAWLIEELSDKYQIPQHIGREWVEGDHVHPLLDGLDEVSPASRAACIDTITTYRKEHGLVPLVVCSRKDDYLNLPARLLLQQAVCIQPLTWRQIDMYLINEGEWSQALRTTLSNDGNLQQLVTTPLMLNVFTIAYQGQPAEELKEWEALEERRRRIFATYVERMLKRRKPMRHYTPRQSERWLAYLAQQMLKRHQTEFLLESIQLDWLPTRRLQYICSGLVIGLETGLAGALLAGFIALLLYNVSVGKLSIVLSSGLCSLFNAALFNRFLSQKLDKHLLANQTTQRSMPYALWNGLVVGVLDWLVLSIVGVGARSIFPDLTLDFIIVGGLFLSLLLAWIIGLNKGGEAGIKRLVVRLLLWIEGYIPWNYLYFLEDAVERILLRKTAIGYIFVHQMLLEYFASLNQQNSFQEQSREKRTKEVVLRGERN